MELKKKVALLTVALSTLVSGWAAVSIVGHEARVVEIIALFAGGFGAGASVVAVLNIIRSPRRSEDVLHPNTEGRGPGEA